jgi:D-lysine 5,6-aminomutase alpha subunit-like protein
MASPADWGPLDRLADLAQTLAGAWGGRARASTTVGQERAILRLFGVHGLDAAGRPLAGEVADRYIGHDRSRLGSGIALPFAMALLEYDIAPQQLALDVASGAIDLALEAELLRQVDRRHVAEEEAARLSSAALARVDANRTARGELVGLLGDAPPPWIGTTVVEHVVDAAVDEATRRIEEGVDLLRVEVPVGRELATSLTDARLETADWPWHETRPTDRRDVETTPAGSQRGLTELRHVLDEVAANRRRYVRLATAAPPLAAPEQAVVAAFERVDLVEADAMAEIVAGGVDPDRALADHAFAHRLLRRAGTTILVGAGPLVVAPDLVSGVPSDPATRAGRALALQMLGVALAKFDGLSPERIVVGALPPWLTDESAPAARAAAEVALRRALLPDHPMGFEEPVALPEAADTWPFVLSGVLPPGTATAVIMRRPIAGSMRTGLAAGRAAVSVGAELATAHGGRGLEGIALEHARGVVAAAIRTLERLGDIGWRSVLGEAPGGGERIRIGADAVAERSEGFDAIARDLAPTA